MNIPDQYRAHWFMKDVEQRFLSGRANVPFVRQHRHLQRSRRDSRRAEGYPYLAS